MRETVEIGDGDGEGDWKRVREIGENMKCAAVKRWHDNPTDVQVIEYFATREDCESFIRNQPKSLQYDWEVGVYE